MNGERRLAPAHWLLIGIAVLLVAGGIAVVLSRGTAGPADADPTAGPASAAPSGSATPRADCAPEVTSTWADGALFGYGFVYRSKCDQVVRKLRFRVAAVDKAGDEVTTDDAIANGGVLFPGAELAAAGELRLPAGAQVAGLKVQVIDFTVQAAADFSGWARVQVTDPVQGKPDARGEFTVTGTVRAEPAGVPVCVSEFVLVLRNKTDKVVYAGRDPVAGETVLKPDFTVVPVAGADSGKTKIYAPQTPRTDQAPRAGAPCDGS